MNNFSLNNLDINILKKKEQTLISIIQKQDFFKHPNFVQINKDYNNIIKIINNYNQSLLLQKEINNYQEMLLDPETELELKSIIEDEIIILQNNIKQIENKIISSIITSDNNNHKNIIMEIRSGAGGLEASLFVNVLFRMYTKFAETHSWKIELLNKNPSECGGQKEISFMIYGKDVYKYLKYESGVHRVQRIPVTESNGRVHTSTVTVAVLPEAKEIEIDINPSDLEISICRSSGPGGQSVNTTDSAVQIVHIPSGIMVTCSDERSQQKNRLKAMTVLRSRLLRQKEEEEKLKYDTFRKNLIGSGDRSERIRTYNFPQGRITDHRIGLTLKNIDQIINGNISPIIEKLQIADKAEEIDKIIKSA